ncbi:MAG: hypothetical protein H7251_11210 [Acetobacteraceae bacterium]|nr:hypothetical protein [Acetobacteraceae bacterium]
MVLYIAVDAIEDPGRINGVGRVVTTGDAHGTLCFFFCGASLHGVLAIVNQPISPLARWYPVFTLDLPAKGKRFLRNSFLQQITARDYLPADSEKHDKALLARIRGLRKKAVTACRFMRICWRRRLDNAMCHAPSAEVACAPARSDA